MNRQHHFFQKNGAAARAPMPLWQKAELRRPREPPPSGAALPCRGGCSSCGLGSGRAPRAGGLLIFFKKPTPRARCGIGGRCQVRHSKRRHCAGLFLLLGGGSQGRLRAAPGQCVSGTPKKRRAIWAIPLAPFFSIRAREARARIRPYPSGPALPQKVCRAARLPARPLLPSPSGRGSR